METEGIEGMAGIEIFGMAGIVGIDGALLNHPPTFDETPENTPPAFAALKYRTEKFHSKKTSFKKSGSYTQTHHLFKNKPNKHESLEDYE